METLRAALAESMRECSRLRRHILQESEQELVELALAIAEQVVGRELQANSSFVFAQAKEGIALLASKEPVTIAISPVLAEQIPAETWEAQCGVTVEVDPGLANQHVEVKSGLGRVDVGTSARILAVAKTVGES
jgi:flagellar biosynthesis/type III secretory pathway protein FliH